MAYFQQMLKHADPVKFEREAQERFMGLLGEIPFIDIERIEREPTRSERPVDLVLRVKVHGRPHIFICEVKKNSQPRHVRNAIAQLRYHVNPNQSDVSGVIIAPYLSADAQQLCRAEHVGFLDFDGNCHLEFDGVFIDRKVPAKAFTERRELKSIFAPKSAQVLRALLREPSRHWLVKDLAKVANVSLGHVSNVRTALIDREWAKADKSGLIMSDPDALLDTWRNAYKPPAGKRSTYYTALHGKDLQDATRSALQPQKGRSALLASFSAAQWLAPYARINTQFFYADDRATKVLQNKLQLTSSAKGENVSILEPKDSGLFLDAIEPAPGLRCTSAVQTYLDLWTAGDRGQEAAEHLRAEKLQWRK